MRNLPMRKRLFLINAVILLLFILLIPVGIRYVELQPSISKCLRIYLIIIIIGQVIDLGYTVVNWYLNQRKKQLTIEEKIINILYEVWLGVGVFLIVATFVRKFEVIPLLIIYLLTAPLVMVTSKWLNEE